MQPDPEDPSRALAVDVLAPEGYGEIIGGSERSDSLEHLERQIAAHDLPREAFEWYLDVRRYGSFPHVGLRHGHRALCGLDLRDLAPAGGDSVPTADQSVESVAISDFGIRNSQFRIFRSTHQDRDSGARFEVSDGGAPAAAILRCIVKS